jgi:hypothetical protein
VSAPGTPEALVSQMAHQIVIYSSWLLAMTRQILDDFVNQET